MKKLFAISLAVLMVLATVGCNTTTMGPTTEPTTEPATEAPKTDEPTALPTATPQPDLEQDIIEAAWAFAELIEQVHEQQFIRREQRLSFLFRVILQMYASHPPSILMRCFI